MKNAQGGNVLFMILIAVALFAALSYAVLSSSRSGGADAGSETNLVNSAAWMQFPNSVRAGLMRMMVIEGYDITEIEFNRPSDFAFCSNSGDKCIFHPSGGGVPYVNQLPEVAFPSTMPWGFTELFEIENVGTTVAGSFEGNEIIAFTWSTNKNLCEKINEKLGISGVPLATITAFAIIVNSDNLPNGWAADIEQFTIGIAAGNGTDVLTGQPQGCFETTGFSPPLYMYYHVLLER